MSQQINLFNPIFKQQKKYLSAVTMAQALGLILLGSLLLAGYAGYRSHRLAQDSTVVTTQLNNAQTTLAKVSVEYAPREKNKGLEQEIQKTEADLQSLQHVAGILNQGELGNTQGYASYMRAFARQIIDGVWLTGFHIHGAGNEIGLLGRAVNPELVPAYISRLKTEQILQGKAFSRFEMQMPKNADAAKSGTAGLSATASHIEFSLQSTAAPNATNNAGVNSR